MQSGAKAPWPAVPADVATMLRWKLSELMSEAPTDEELGGRSGVQISFGEGGPSQQQLLKYVLVDVLGCRDLGRSDKTAWEVVFGFRGAACVMAFRKFGMRLEVYPPSNVTEEALRNLIGDLQEQLVSAEKLVERMVFQDFIAQQVDAGAVTVINQQERLRGMYTYFRELTAAVQAGNGQLLNLPSSRETFLFAPQRESYFLTVAMVNAYFSMLEHLLVLMLPFSGYDPAQDDMVRFIGLSWRDKYKRVLPPKSDLDAARLYERLFDIAERFRNTHIHGGFDRIITVVSLCIAPEVHLSPILRSGRVNPTTKSSLLMGATSVISAPSLMSLTSGLVVTTATDGRRRAYRWRSIVSRFGVIEKQWLVTRISNVILIK